VRPVEKRENETVGTKYELVCARSIESEALHQEQLEMNRERRKSTGGRAIGRELARHRKIARYEVRDTKSNRKARNRSRLGSTVGGYQVAIRTLRQLVLARASVTCLENTVGGYQVTICTLRQLVLARSGVTGLELDNQRRLGNDL
jgi:hypothetical protein